MKIQLKFFGQLAEVIGKSQMEVAEIYSTDSLINKMLIDYPKLHNYKFLVSIDKKIVNENKALESGHEVAFLPPFAGG